MKTSGRIFLVAGAVCSFSISILHLGIIVIGAPAYLYFGTIELAFLAAQGSLAPAILTFFIAVMFALFGLYALSGAGIVRPLPFIELALPLIGSVYSLRGLIVILDVIRLLRGADYPFRQTVFSGISLVIGLSYLIGTLIEWRNLRVNRTLSASSFKSMSGGR